MKKYFTLLALVVVLSSCGEYNKVLKSTDYNYKFEYAKKAFAEKRYNQAATLLEDVVTIFKGTDKAEESLYLLGLSYYENKDYLTAGTYFKSYYQHYPRGQYAELARYYAGYGYYLDSPDSQLDQTETIKAIEELQAFLDYFPTSDKVPVAQNAILSCKTNSCSRNLKMPNFITTWAITWATTTRALSSQPKTPLKSIPTVNIKNNLKCWCSRLAIAKRRKVSTKRRKSASAPSLMSITLSLTTTPPVPTKRKLTASSKWPTNLLTENN